MAALETRELEGNEVGMASRVLRGPHLLRGVFAVAVLPGIADVHGMLDEPCLDVFPKERVDDVLVDGQRLQRQNGVTDLLELLEDFVVDAGIVVVGAAQKHDADAVLGLQPFQDFPALGAQDLVHEFLLRLHAGLDGAVILFPRQAEDVNELIVELLGQ